MQQERNATKRLQEELSTVKKDSCKQLNLLTGEKAASERELATTRQDLVDAVEKCGLAKEALATMVSPSLILFPT